MIYPNKPLYLLSLLGYIYRLTYYTLTTKDNIVDNPFLSVRYHYCMKTCSLPQATHINILATVYLNKVYHKNSLADNKKGPPEPAKMQRSRRVMKSDFNDCVFFCDFCYIVMKMNFRQNNSPITATMMSFFSNLPVNRVITV